jgi:hypothetical protein
VQLSKRDMKAELEERERKHFQDKAKVPSRRAVAVRCTSVRASMGRRGLRPPDVSV